MHEAVRKDERSCCKLLFFGRDSNLRVWAEMGVVDMRPALSRAPHESGRVGAVQVCAERVADGRWDGYGS